MGYSTKRKRGRPKVQRTPFDHGNDRVQARAELFKKLAGESSKGHEMSCPGRLMLCGAFDGMEQAPETYLSALLEYADGYWGHWGGGAKIGQYERSDRSQDNSDHTTPDPRGAWFNAMDARLRDAGHMARKAVHLCSVERHWFPDEDANFAARIIATRLLQKGIRVEFAILADDADWRWLELLRDGVRALVEPQMRRAA